MRHSGLRGKSGARRVEAVWAETVGAETAAHTTTGALRKGALSVAVDSAPLYYELVSFRSEEIRKALNEKLKSITVQKINFHLNKVKT
jgi:hypothetical protein